MKRLSVKYIFLLSFLWLSCSERGRLEELLALSGDNRKEVEAVLSHYKGDSLKLQAACFLIENMLGQGTVEYTFIDRNGNKYSLEELSVIRRDTLFEMIKFGKFEQASAHPDLLSVSAGYLIENIDIAFETWRRYPWCSSLPFESFCRDVLPYRIKQEPLERWRSFYYHRYKIVADSLAQAGATREQVVFFFNAKYGKKYIHNVSKMPGDLPLSLIERLGGGTCDHLALNAAQLLRSVGVPLHLDLLPYHGKINGGHAYNSFVDESGRLHFFSPYERQPERAKWTAPLVLRVCYELQPESIVKVNPWNALLVNRHLKNVTNEYYKTCDVALPAYTEDTLAFLATYNRGDFKVVAQARRENDGIRFPMLTCGLLYYPMVAKGQQLFPAGKPFIVSDAGEVEYISMNRKEVVMEGVRLYDASKVLKPGQQECYTLYYWNDGWQPVKKAISTDSETLNFGRVPVDALFLVRGETAIGRMQRPFLVQEGEYVYY